MVSEAGVAKVGGLGACPPVTDLTTVSSSRVVWQNGDQLTVGQGQSWAEPDDLGQLGNNAGWVQVTRGLELSALI